MTAGFSVFTVTTEEHTDDSRIECIHCDHRHVCGCSCFDFEQRQSAAPGDSDALSLKPSWLTHVCQHIHVLKTTCTHPRTVC